MDRQVVERRQISQWVRLITYSDGSAVIWQGSNRVELSAYEAVCLGLTPANTPVVSQQ
jgi:hypothetical protein